MLIKRLLEFPLIVLAKLYSLKSLLQKLQFNRIGKNVTIGHHCSFSYKNITIGNNVSIGDYASFISTISKIEIGNYVLIGPNVTIRGGNHRYDLIGKYIFEITENEKLSIHDGNVIIEDDVWIGCNCTILKGVVVGRGSVIGAATVLRHDVPPYSVVIGNPSRLIKMRFSNNQIEEHENKLSKNKE